MKKLVDLVMNMDTVLNFDVPAKASEYWKMADDQSKNCQKIASTMRLNHATFV